MAKEYLDKSGLSYLWGKIKTYFVKKSGDTMTGNLVMPSGRIANTYYGVTFDRTITTPKETILYTGIKWVSGRHMPVIHITGYAYGLQSPVEFKIAFYLYGDQIGWCGVTNMGSWNPDVYLFKYTRDSVDYVAVGLSGQCYFLQLSADVQDEMGKFSNIVINSANWSWSFLTTTGNIPTADGGITCIKVPYRADILNPSKVNGHTVNSDVPANAKFTDTVTTVDSAFSATSTNPVQNKIITNAVGAANGIASLGSDGKVPTSQLPNGLPATIADGSITEAKLDTALAAKVNAKPIYEDFVANFTYAAGTVGTRGAQVNLGSVAKTGYAPVSATVIYCSSSASFIPSPIISSNVLYLNAYRASTAAVNNGVVHVRVGWIPT